MLKEKADLIKKIAKYVFFFGIVFGGVAVAFMQAGGGIVADPNDPTLVNIEGGSVGVDQGSIEIKRDPMVFFCDSDLYFCEEEKIEICTSQFPDEDYIAVAKTDHNSGTSYQWKTSQTFCVGPQCVDLGISYTGMVLTNEHDVDFSLYPARNACKSYGEGARLPTEGELSCIYTNRSSFGTFASAAYWSATENSEAGARRINFSDGTTHTYPKTFPYRVRCVLGY